jgi:hypothetical protein
MLNSATIVPVLRQDLDFHGICGSSNRPKINEQHKKERRKDLPWDRHTYMEVLNWLIGFPSPL